MSVNNPTDPWTDHTSNCWPLEEHHYEEVFAVCASLRTDDPSLWNGILSPSARAAALRENRGHRLNWLQFEHECCAPQVSERTMMRSDVPNLRETVFSYQGVQLSRREKPCVSTRRSSILGGDNCTQQYWHHCSIE